MPPRRPDQCVFHDSETGRRCRKNGTGDPALCLGHREELDQREASPLADMLGSILRGQRPSQRSVEEAIRSTVENMFGRAMSQAELDALLARARAAATGARAGSSSQSDASSSSGARSTGPRERYVDPEMEKARAISRARKTLGFTAKEPLDKATVKKRYRELAMKWHPDRPGGNVAKMAEINQAVEILVGPG